MPCLALRARAYHYSALMRRLAVASSLQWSSFKLAGLKACAASLPTCDEKPQRQSDDRRGRYTGAMLKRLGIKFGEASPDPVPERRKIAKLYNTF